MKLLNFIGVALGLFGIYTSYIMGSWEYCERALAGGGKNSLSNPSAPMTWVGITCAYLVILCAYNLTKLYTKGKHKIES